MWTGFVHVYCLSIIDVILVCVGDVESTEPTKMLMRIAEHLDTGSSDLREWFLNCREEILDMLAERSSQFKNIDSKVMER